MLKKRAADGDPIPYAAKMQMAQEVAQGMAHLTSRRFSEPWKEDKLRKKRKKKVANKARQFAK